MVDREILVYRNPRPERKTKANPMAECLAAIREDRCGWALTARSAKRGLTRGERRRKYVCRRCRVIEGPSQKTTHRAEPHECEP